MKPEHVAMWPVRPLLRTWGIRTVKALDAGWERDPAAGELVRIWRFSNSDQDPQHAFESLTVRRSRPGNQPDAWQHDATLFLVGDMAILRTTNAHLIEVVEAALQEAEKGLTRERP
ncbi:MAG: hypothetical protein AABZ53_12200 [Planctomycetota bacterium]